MRARILFVTLMGSALAAAARAQTAPLSGTISAVAAIPVGPLVGNRGSGVGATAAIEYEIPGIPALAISAEVSGLAKAAHTNLNQAAVPNYTTNGSSAVLAGIGPRLSIPAGDTHFYVTGVVGVARLWATSTLHPVDEEQYNTSPSSITTGTSNFMWAGGGGVVVPFPGTHTRASANIGVRYYDLGIATYAVRYSGAVLVGGANGVFPQLEPQTARARATILAPSVGITLRL
jgi:hypothetical protein